MPSVSALPRLLLPAAAATGLLIRERACTAHPAQLSCRLASLASTVMTLLEAMVQKTEGQLSESAKVLQEILSAAADERGEWHLPLAEDKIQAMTKVWLPLSRPYAGTHAVPAGTAN